MTTAQNIANMQRQLRRRGLSHDPRREISTADPKFYRWTQWIFLQLFSSWCDPDTGQARPVSDLVAEFERGTRRPASEANPGERPWPELDDVTRRRVIDSYRLAFRSEAPVNWCPGPGTVLANEEVTADGRSQIGNYPVYRRRMKQWMLRITAFADRLLADLDGPDWTDSLKTCSATGSAAASARTYASGRAGAARSRYSPPVLTPCSGPRSWSWRPSTRWLRRSRPGDEAVRSPRRAVAAYVARTARVSDRQRQAETSKTAVFLGRHAVNPVSGAKMPILISDYVLAGYGTGAIMAVPAHDQRDYELATGINLPVVPVVRPGEQWLSRHPGAVADDPVTWGEAFHADGTLANSHGDGISLDGLGTGDAKNRVVEWLEESGLGARRIAYKLFVYDETGLPIALPESQLPATLPPMTDFRPHAVGGDEDPRAPLSRAPGFEMAELDLGDGPRQYRRETSTMPQWAGSCWYYLRYLDPDNAQRFVDPVVERFWMAGPGEAGRPGGVDLYIGGVEHDGIDDVAFPAADREAIREDSVTIPVTLDGKPRGTITIARDAAQDDAMAAGLQLESVARLAEGSEIARVVFVAGKILNIVTRARG